MPVVAFPGVPDALAAGGTLTDAVARFLDSLDAATTRAGYALTLARLTAITGPDHQVAELTQRPMPR